MYLAVADGKRIERIGRKYPKPGTVVAVQSTFGGHPDEAVPALQDIENHALRQPVVDRKLGNGRGSLRADTAGAKQQQENGKRIFHQGPVETGLKLVVFGCATALKTSGSATVSPAHPTTGSRYIFYTTRKLFSPEGA